MTAASNSAIASRIRGLLGGQGDIKSLAHRLGVDEVALRISIDQLSPYPTMGVLAAVVREYGVDPSWLLTGEYRESAHREALQTATGELPVMLTEVARRYGTDTPAQLRIVRDG